MFYPFFVFLPLVFAKNRRKQVRAVQRRVGLLASASDLSEEFKQELRGVRAALEQQRVCNAAVDRVVSEEVCWPAPPFILKQFFFSKDVP